MRHLRLAALAVLFPVAACGGMKNLGNRVLATRNRIMASHLHDGVDRTPHGLGEAVDISHLVFMDVHSGQAVNLRDYMDKNQRNYMLLVFGSVACSTCNDEAERLRDQVIAPPNPLFLTDQGKHFEIVGVNIDPAGTHGVVQHSDKFPFIKWQDHSGELMNAYFLPKGDQVKVPLTVMLDRSGTVHWLVLPDEAAHLRTEDLVDRVAVTLGLGGGETGGNVGGSTAGQTGGGTAGQTGGDTGGATAGQTGGATAGQTGGATAGQTGGATAGQTGGDSGGQTGGQTGGATGPDVPSAPLAQALPGRLKSVNLAGCDGHALTLDAALGPADWRFVQVTKGACGDACQANLAALKALACPAGVKCAVASVDTTAPAAGECATGVAYQGGAEFFDVFATHFNWAYTPVDGDQLTLPPVQGPLVFGFGPKGELSFSFEGKLAAGQLAAAVGAGPAPAKGPDYHLYTKDGGEFGFSKVRLKAKYTVIATWGQLCSSCIDELKHWSQPGQLAAYCAAHPADCQIVGLEFESPKTGETLAQFYDRLMNGDGSRWKGLNAMGITVPAVLDPVPNADGNNYLHRIFEGYITALEPGWGGEPGALIYDQEGKVVAGLKSEEPPATGDDAVFTKVKQLLGR